MELVITQHLTLAVALDKLPQDFGIQVKQFRFSFDILIRANIPHTDLIAHLCTTLPIIVAAVVKHVVIAMVSDDVAILNSTLERTDCIVLIFVAFTKTVECIQEKCGLDVHFGQDVENTKGCTDWAIIKRQIDFTPL